MPAQQPQLYGPGVNPKPKKPIYKKWWFWVLAILAVIIIIAIATSGGGDPKEPQTDASGNTVTSTRAVAAGDKNTMENAGTLGDYQIEIVSARIGKDYVDDNPVLIVTYKWTNNSADAASFMFAFGDKAFQDGIQCESNFFVKDQKGDVNTEIRSGATLELEKAYTLNNTTSPVEIEVDELISFSGKKVVKTFDLN